MKLRAMDEAAGRVAPDGRADRGDWRIGWKGLRWVWWWGWGRSGREL